MSENNIIQDLRDFTVQIRRLDNDAIVGTGIAVSQEGEIVTCAHVVKSATGKQPREAGNAEVGIYFPQARGDERKERRAIVARYLSNHVDDVAILHLTDGAPPLGPEQIAKLGPAKHSAGNGFRSYGYASVGNRLARYAHGEIMGPVEVVVKNGEKVLAEPVELRTRNVRRGLSGGAVLDVERNLVVGLITEYWLYDGDPDNIAYATDCTVLTFDEAVFELHDAPLPKAAAPQPQADFQRVARQIQPVPPDSQFHAAPPPLAEWVGRTELLEGLSHDFNDPDRRVTGLIGFGGEGKSSLARRWVDSLGDFENRPTGVFWWGFYDNQNVDEFFEAALGFISGGQIDPRRMRSSSVRAQVIAAMLANGRYVFVLDGLEVLQRQDGDDYGLLRSPDLQTFLELFAAPGHSSFCLITSRAPLLDLLAYTSYTHRDVGPVSVPDGRALLRELGVTGPDAALDQLARQWDGHALTLSLLGSYLKWQHAGDVAFANEFDDLVGSQHAATLPEDAPDEARQRYSHVHRVLRRYDEHLTAAERAFMTLFSAFRTPVAPDAFARVFRTAPEPPTGRGESVIRPGGGQASGLPLQQVLAELNGAEFDGLLARLVGYRLLRHNETTHTYTTHPLVRSHYLALLTGSGQAKQTHDQLKDYYLALAGDTPHHPTLADLAPLIEVVYHACRAGAYDEAFQIYRDRIDQKERWILANMGAWETDLNLNVQFFPYGDLNQEAQVSHIQDKSWVLNELGLCFMNLGHLSMAVPFYERAAKLYSETQDWRNASTCFRNLSDLSTHLGRLDLSVIASEKALSYARRADDLRHEQFSLMKIATVAHLLGRFNRAKAAFEKAKAHERTLTKQNHIYSLGGIWYAEHLLKAGQVAYSREVTTANLMMCENKHWTDHISQCHRVLGELEVCRKLYNIAFTHFDKAVIIARSVSVLYILIEALLARGRWAAKLVVANPDLTGAPERSTTTTIEPGHLSGLTTSEPGHLSGLTTIEPGHLSGLPQAFSDLREALGYATDGGYRRYEADCRVALAWAYLASNNPTEARQEASRAQTLSRDMGYHWGQVDAAEILNRLP